MYIIRCNGNLSLAIYVRYLIKDMQILYLPTGILSIRKRPGLSVEVPKDGSSGMVTKAYSTGALVLVSITIPLMVWNTSFLLRCLK